jgi:hypothetical protein
LFLQALFSIEAVGTGQAVHEPPCVLAEALHVRHKQLPLGAVNNADLAGLSGRRDSLPEQLSSAGSSPMAVHCFSPFLTVSDISHASPAQDKVRRQDCFEGAKHQADTVPAAGPPAPGTPLLHPVLVEFFNSYPTGTHAVGSTAHLCHTAPSCLSGTGSPYQTVAVFASPATEAALLDSSGKPSTINSAADDDWDDMEAQMLLTGSDLQEVALAQQHNTTKASKCSKTDRRGTQRPTTATGPNGPLGPLWQKVAAQQASAQLAPRPSANQPAINQHGFQCATFE